MLDLARYKGLLPVVAGLCCSLVLCNAVLLGGFGESPAMFDNPDRKLAWSQLERVGAQVAGVELQMGRKLPGTQPGFGVVIGQSTTFRGIDPLILEQKAGPRKRWLLINGFGSSFVKLDYYAQTLLASKLRPETIVLGLHETMLAGQDRRNVPVEPSASEPGSVRSKKKSGVRRQVKRGLTVHWVRRHRADISHFTNMALFELRLSIHKALGSGAVGLHKPRARPWRVSARDELPDRHEERLKVQRKNWRKFGWFESSTYHTDGPQADAFRSLIAGCNGLGTPEIVIVLLPITSDLRGWLPVEAGQQMVSLIDEVSIGRSVRVIDLREAMPDDAFADYAHLNPSGREVFSRLLADQLNKVDPSD